MSKKNQCLIWIPSLSHEEPKLKAKTAEYAKKHFRISDNQIAKDSEAEKGYFEQWAKVEVTESEKGAFPITVKLYKNTEKRVISQLEKLKDYTKEIENAGKRRLKILYPSEKKEPNFLEETELLILGARSSYNEWRRDRIEKKVKNLPPPDEKSLELVSTIRMNPVAPFCMVNGMMLYECVFGDGNEAGRQFFSKPRDKNVWEVPPCIYHRIKEFFHIHEFHDDDNDTITTPYLLTDDDLSLKLADDTTEDCNDLLKRASSHYLDDFHKHFKELREKYTEKWIKSLPRSKRRSLEKKNGDSSKQSLLRRIQFGDRAFLWASSAFIACGVIIIFFRNCKDLLWAPGTVFALLFSFVLSVGIYHTIRWWDKVLIHISPKLLRLDGEYGYAQTLISNMPPESRLDIHNVVNNYNVAKSYLETYQRKVHTRFAVWTFIPAFILSVALVIWDKCLSA